jgi:SgrR family transcriptional regulator
MPNQRLNQQYIQLYQCFAGQSIATSLQQLAEVLGCTRRHMRNLLQRMQQLGWIDWRAQVGRGGRSALAFNRSVDSLLRDRAASLLEQGKIEQAVGLLGDDQHQLSALLLSRLGQRWSQDRQVLTVPYYRALPNLYPGTPLRRSERHVVSQVFNGLTCINEEKGEVSAALAHHWYQQGPQQWHFHLRPAVRWHDGKMLTVADVQASLMRLRALPLFAHILDVQPLSAHSLAITLSEPDQWLPWLLADSAAMILPADHGTRPQFASLPIGTGPYRVSANDGYHLCLQAFDDYFGYRALLDEVDIWMVPQLDPLQPHRTADACQLQVQINPGASGIGSAEMVAEQGCHFLLCDARSPLMRSQPLRHWLADTLSPLNLISLIPAGVRQYWTPAASLLPQWFHEEPRQPGPAPAALSTLRLAYPEQQPDYPVMAQAMAACLARQQITLECHSVPFADWEQGVGAFDLWLGSINFATQADYAVPAWILGTPLLVQCLSGDQALPVTQWHSAWHQGQQDGQSLAAQVVQHGWLQPLFHSWFRLQGSERMQGVRLNNLGWFDFKSAWLAP